MAVVTHVYVSDALAVLFTPRESAMHWRFAGSFIKLYKRGDACQYQKDTYKRWDVTKQISHLALQIHVRLITYLLLYSLSLR